MSDLTDLFGKGKGRGRGNDWTKLELTVVVGMKIVGATRKQISEAFGVDDQGKPIHSEHSVTYCTGRKLPELVEKHGGVEGLFKYLGVQDKEEVLKITEEFLADKAE